MNSLSEVSNEDALRNRLIGWLPHALVILGVALSFLDSRFLLIAAAGFFGPGILQELGWVEADEFQKETRLRAGHHAYLFGGLFLATIISFNGMGQQYNAEMHKIDDAVPASLVLTLMLAVYYLSRLVRYWGPRKAAFRIIAAFSLAFLALAALAFTLHGIGTGGITWRGPIEVLVIAAVMLAAAFLGRKHPRAAALLLLLPTAWLIKAGSLWSWFTNSSVPWEVALDAMIFTLLLPVTGIVAFLVSSRANAESD